MYGSEKSVWRASLLLLALALVSILGGSVYAFSGPVLDVARPLAGTHLGRHFELLRDDSRSLSLADLQSGAYESRFTRPSSEAPSLGYSASAMWLRLQVENSGGVPESWLLDVQYPHLDDVQLYVPRADGSYALRQTGDSYPFSQRDIAYRTFLFALEEPPESSRTYYLRVATSSSISLPIAAWKPAEFLEYQSRETGALFLFYGIALAMACYNLCACLFVRQTDYLHYLTYIIACFALQTALSGHLFQFAFPELPWLTDQMLPWCMAAALSTSLNVASTYLSLREAHPKLHRVLRHAAWGCLLLSALTTGLPYASRMMLMALSFVLIAAFTNAVCIYLWRRGMKRAQYYMLAWVSAAFGMSLFWLKAAGILPANFWTTWALHIGSSIQLVIMSSVLGERIHAMRADLGALNVELSRKVTALESTLLQAEEATIRAEQATRVKDEFMATVSHELRTPLNAIINVPQGLLRDFHKLSCAVCASCGSTFEIEPGEQVNAETPCPECHRRGGLEARPLMRYSGDPERTARYLTMIERSGKHLLQMVNGVLDSSKLQAGRLELTLEPFDVVELLREVADEMTPNAERAGVQVEIERAPTEGTMMADPLRVKQVLINLLGNAIKFSEARGTVTLGAEVREGGVLLYVRDRGIGIAAEDFERIFVTFEQVHKGNTRKYGGTGLGLSISRSLVRMHGGELWVESELGKGSTFYFRIPQPPQGGRIRATTSSHKRVTRAVEKSLNQEMSP